MYSVDVSLTSPATLDIALICLTDSVAPLSTSELGVGVVVRSKKAMDTILEPNDLSIVIFGKTAARTQDLLTEISHVYITC